MLLAPCRHTRLPGHAPCSVLRGLRSLGVTLCDQQLMFNRGSRGDTKEPEAVALRLDPRLNRVAWAGLTKLSAKCWNGA